MWLLRESRALVIQEHARGKCRDASQRAGVPMSVWSGWAGKSVTATLYAAKMLVNAIAEGPYQAAPLVFSVTP